ncbi:Spondin_N [Seminavis robusta]|uniref:Spondin_N n=1 Tax=Seminavis robusta TaxID=568900 RepID=A0A9N8EQ96_9STRA|nr:Spondin_N [Seminavis robusta]|eukprot:Sro1394_g268980.1 Spondin_N (159) ;mRNA; r:25325-25801
MQASEELARLAEDGDPTPLVQAYNASFHAGYVGIQNEGAPYFGGETLEFVVPHDLEYPYLTIAAMAVNSNDCFVALNGVKLEPKAILDGPGYDSGSEENNELCSSIPGPACDAVTGNARSGNGEGFVHVHRGFFGVGDLSQPGYDWRNPMMRVEMDMM